MGYLKEVNIKYDMPTADLAVRRTTYAIENGRTLGASAVKLIHGYGSTGKGGKIRLEVRAYLERQKARGQIRDLSLIHIWPCAGRSWQGIRRCRRA